MAQQAEASAGSKTAIVIGAGIVGICCALYLQRDGHQVTVIDPGEPGDACSYGNAGIFANEHCNPEAEPGLLSRVPSMLLNPLGPLAIRPSYLPRALPYLMGVLRQSAPAKREANSVAMHAINTRALPAYEPLIRAASAQNMVKHTGWLTVYESDEAFAHTKAAKLPLQDRRGVPYELLDAEGVQRMNPALSRSVKHGIYYPEVAQATDPHRFVRVLAGYFASQGGQFLRERAVDFELAGGRVKAVITRSGPKAASVVVVAAGVWSKPLAAKLGAKVPLEAERGYHAMLPTPGVALDVPVIYGDFHCSITPMEGGIRVGGTVEFGGVEAAPNPERSETMVRLAQRLLPGVNVEGAAHWMGHRPALPDSLPVLGRAPKARNAYLAFGHGMLGLTLGGISGRVIADLVSHRNPEMDVHPYRASRFNLPFWAADYANSRAPQHG